MLNGIYKNAAGALAAQTRLDVLSNNLANLSTPGFRRGFAIFQERQSQVWEAPILEPGFDPVRNAEGGGIFVHETAFSSDTGPLDSTGNPLDLAIQGDGWFRVARGGEELFTRAGNFALGPNGEVVSPDGRAQLLDEKGRPVVLPLEHGNVTVHGDGTIEVDGEALTRIEVLGTVDYKSYEPAGDNLYRHRPGTTPEASVEARIEQGFVERSTVKPVLEMVRLIRTFRAYESNTNAIQQQDESLGLSTSQVGRLS